MYHIRNVSLYPAFLYCGVRLNIVFECSRVLSLSVKVILLIHRMESNYQQVTKA